MQRRSGSAAAVGLLLLLAVTFVACMQTVPVAGMQSSVGAHAHAHVGADVRSLQVPKDPDMTCKSFNEKGYRSSACTNVDWKTAGWILDQAVNTRALDWELETVFAGGIGTKKCKRWYRDLLCRHVYPKCLGGDSGPLGGPCRVECEDFSLSCPGMAMSCAAFEKDEKKCWKSTTKYVYGANAATTNSMTRMSMIVTLTMAVMAAAIGRMALW